MTTCIVEFYHPQFMKCGIPTDKNAKFWQTLKIDCSPYSVTNRKEFKAFVKKWGLKGYSHYIICQTETDKKFAKMLSELLEN